MDLHPDVFWDLTFAEFEIKAEGYHHRQERQWQHTRFIAAFFATSASGKVTQPEEIRPVIFDKNSTVKGSGNKEKITAEEVEAFQKKWLKSEKKP
jgi:hypothetical protein